MKPEKLIKYNILSNRMVAEPPKVVFEEIALTAVNMARTEAKEVAYDILDTLLDEWMNEAEADCILEEFKNELDKALYKNN